MVSLIILSYNTKDLLKQCLMSITAYANIPHEIIVVDNASTDGSIKMLQELEKSPQAAPDVIIIENKENFGFGKGINIGAKQAKGEYLLFLNSDAEFIDDSLSQMVKFAENHEDVGVIGGKTGKQRSFGKFLSLSQVFLLLFAERFLGKQESKIETTQKTDWVSGGFMMIRRSVFEKVHGFDERIFMYIEDMELCFRVKKAGYGVYFMPEARVKHIGQGSSNRTFAIVHIYQGLLYFYRKHKSHNEYDALKFMLQLKALTAVFVGTLTGNQYLKSTYKKVLRF